MSKFVKEISNNLDEDNRYQFIMNQNLNDKLIEWASVFASMLVKIAFETQGVVKDCDIVMSASNKYRQGQDHIAGFISERVGKCDGSKINKQELCEEFKVWFQEQQGTKRIPKGVELCEYMDKKFKKIKNGWNDVIILYPNSNSNNEIEIIN